MPNKKFLDKVINANHFIMDTRHLQDREGKVVVKIANEDKKNIVTKYYKTHNNSFISTHKEISKPHWLINNFTRINPEEMIKIYIRTKRRLR